ncbi:chromosomal replication initiator protein DnaA [Porphyromonas macacae]|uniref:Chromosomal replication initiator protein DnaA n=1 Tax=Porphyromonas macacae TaxID=28115 RepID=A0A379DEQ7_9PORP|nr:chromosomal replication initiator protein DnaA [Porphyromonas macacae]SUB76890.1 Chromosomal replication initiator protein DnaA [Porphyromonas macacae]
MSKRNSLETLWQECLTSLRLLTDEKSYETWFAPIEAVNLQNGALTLRVPTEYFSQYLESRYATELSRVLGEHIGPHASLYFTYTTNPEVDKKATEKNLPTGSPQTKEEEKKTFNSHLNEKLSFETFYESDCNHVARAVAEAVAAKPGNAPMNPYFIYGPSGVGKTHLSQAIGLRVKTLHPELRVLYVSSQEFEAQYVTSSRFHERTDFIHFYQQIDVLIVDDIQGLIGKVKTQQAFFEVFNHLKLLNKQIVLTSDKAPIHLSGMEERLVSRIKGSVTVALDKPDIDLRRKILKEKVAESGVKLKDEVIEFIAENVQNNVRELEGTLCSLLTYALIAPDKEIDLTFTRKIVSRAVSLEKPEITMERIQDVVTDVFHVDAGLIKDKTRRQDVVAARHAVMYLAKSYTNQSLNAIGEMLGRRNHATVLHGYNTVKDRMKVDQNFRQTMEKAIERLHV